MKAIKIIFSLLCLCIVIGVFIVASLMYFVDPNKLKPVLIQEVKSETGYELSIDGKLVWSFYPHFAVKAQHLQLRHPQQSEAFLDANGVRIAVDLWQIWQMRGSQSLQGKIAISNLRLMNIKSENITANIDAGQNVLMLNAIKASLYGGTLQGDIKASHFATMPEWAWDIQAQNVQLKPLLQDVNGAESKMNISGLGTLKMQAVTSGQNREQLLRQLKGVTVFNLKDGVVSGMDLNYFLQLADATLNKKPLDQLINTSQTAFNSLDGTAELKNGMADTTDMVLVSPTFTTMAEGSVDLLSRDIDFKLKIKPQLQYTKMKWDIPVSLTGDLNHPELQLDVMGIQKIIAAKQIENLKEKAATQIQKHIPGKTGELLQNLLNR